MTGLGRGRGLPAPMRSTRWISGQLPSFEPFDASLMWHRNEAYGHEECSHLTDAQLSVVRGMYLGASDRGGVRGVTII